MKALLETKGVVTDTKNGDDKTPMEITSENDAAHSKGGMLSFMSRKYPSAKAIGELIKTYDEEKLQSKMDFGK